MLHENYENDESFSMKTQTFENALQSVVWTGRIHWNLRLKTIGDVISVPVHFQFKNCNANVPTLIWKDRFV